MSSDENRRLVFYLPSIIVARNSFHVHAGAVTPKDKYMEAK